MKPLGKALKAAQLTHTHQQQALDQLLIGYSTSHPAMGVASETFLTTSSQTSRYRMQRSKISLRKIHGQPQSTAPTIAKASKSELETKSCLRTKNVTPCLTRSMSLHLTQSTAWMEKESMLLTLMEPSTVDIRMISSYSGQKSQMPPISSPWCHPKICYFVQEVMMTMGSVRKETRLRIQFQSSSSNMSSLFCRHLP